MGATCGGDVDWKLYHSNEPWWTPKDACNHIASLPDHDCDCLSVYANQCTKLGIGATSQALRGSQDTLNTTLPMPNASMQVFNGSSQTGNGTVTTLGSAGALAWYYSSGSCWNHLSGN